MTACGGEPPLKALAADATILAFGDSLTFGKGVSENSSYPSILAKMSGRTVINAGLSGEVSGAGLNRLPGLLDKHKPDLLVLIHGGNDLLRRHNPAQTEKNLESMIDLARQREIDVVMLGVPVPGLVLSPAKLYKRLATKTATPIDEDAIADILQYPSNKSDAVHPNAAGYKMLAEDVYELLQDSGAL